VAYHNLGQQVQDELRVSVGHLFISGLLYVGISAIWSDKGRTWIGRLVRVLYVWLVDWMYWVSAGWSTGMSLCCESARPVDRMCWMTTAGQ
jgi:hypothetical protein